LKQQIIEVIEREIKFTDKEAAENKLNDCINILGKAAKHVSECKGNLERAKKQVLFNYPDLNSRLLKMRIDAETIQEQEELELAEKLWQALNKTIDGLKSLLFIKESDLGWN